MARITRLEKDTPLKYAELFMWFSVAMKGEEYNEDFDENSYDVDKVRNEIIDLLPYELDDTDEVEVYFDEDGNNIDLLINIRIKFANITWGKLQYYEEDYRSITESDIATICGVDSIYVSSGSETKEDIDYKKLDAMGVKDSENETKVVYSEEIMQKEFEKWACKHFDKSEAEFFPEETWFEPVDGELVEQHNPSYYVETFEAELPAKTIITKTENGYTAEVEYSKFVCKVKNGEVGKSDIKDSDKVEAYELDTEEDLKEFVKSLSKLLYWK